MRISFKRRPVEIADYVRVAGGHAATQAYYLDIPHCPELDEDELDELNEQLYQDGEWTEMLA